MYKKIIFVFQFILLLLFSFTLVNAENTLSKDIPFGQSIGSSEYFGSVLDNSDLEELWNGEITFQSIDYSTHEELNLDSSDLLISTSLSSQDDDYETNIYLETNRNSISFYYVFDDSIDLTSTTSVDPITIEFLGSTFEIVSIDSATEFTAIVGGSEETFGDGDPYYAEDSSNPNWVWDLDNLDVSGTSQIFGIENDFVYSSLMDSTITDGNCLSLPKDYVSICFDDLTLQESDYGSYRFEVDTATDLSDVIPSLTSVHTLYILTPVYEGMTLSPYTASETIASSSSAVDVNEVWLYYPGMTDTLSDGSAAPTSTGVVWLGVFYRDPADYLIKEFGHVAMNAENEIVGINYEGTDATNVFFSTTISSSSSELTLRLDVEGDSITELADEEDDLDFVYGLSTSGFDYLGEFSGDGTTSSVLDSSAITWRNSALELGTKDENHRSLYGIIINNPRSNEVDERISLSIPEDQVFATITISACLCNECDEEESSEISMTKEQIKSSEISITKGQFNSNKKLFKAPENWGLREIISWLFFF